jgi:hypothetical protein
VSLFERVREIARRGPGARALSAGETALSYGELVDSIERRAEALAGGSGPVDLDGGHAVAFVVDFFGAARCRRDAWAGRAAEVVSIGVSASRDARRSGARTRP